MRARDITWSSRQLDAYLTAPKKFVPGGKMKYDGLEDSQARADLIAFLATRR
jgi:cytochrome c